MTIYGFDTETDHDDKSAWVCQWVLHDGKSVRKGINLDSFKSCLLSLPKGKHYIYIHNLKYDLEFIKYTLKEIEIEQDANMRVIMRKKNPVSIMLEWDEKRLYFRDSMKKWQGSLRSMGEAYGVPKLEAPDEDFTAGWSKRTDFSDPENWRYVIRDAEIVAVAMQQMHKAGFKKATTSGDAWYCMHRMVNGAQWIPGNDKWSKLFPAIPYELDAQLRPAYFGGINISNRRGRIEGPITHEDKVSMYPGVLYYDSLPFGNPVCIDDQLPEEGQLYIIKVCIKFRIKEGHIPWLQFKQGIDYVLEGNRLRYGEPVDYTDSWHEMTLCNVDLENMKEDYDIEFMGEYRTKCWVFKQQTGILRPYID